MDKYSNDDVHVSAMLVDLRVSQWTARKQDKRVAYAVATANSVDASVGSYYKSVIDPSVLDHLKKQVTATRHYHYKMTLPWSDEGPRVLAAGLYWDYMAKMQEFREAFNNAAQQILTQYPYHREQAKLFLGSLFKDEDYPDPDRLALKYEFNLRITPLPKGADFRCEIGAEGQAQMQAQIEEQTRAALQVSVDDAFKRVLDVTSRYVDRLGDPDAVFRDSLVENARELADLLPKLNFTDDPHLARISGELQEKLTQHEPETLRHNKTARAETTAAAKEIVSDIENIFGGNR